MSEGQGNGERDRDDARLSVLRGQNRLHLGPGGHVSMDDGDLAGRAVADQCNGPMSGPFRREGDWPGWNQNRVGVDFIRAVDNFHTIANDGNFCGIFGNGGSGSAVTFPGSGAFLPSPCSFFHLYFGGKFGFLVLHIAF